MNYQLLHAFSGHQGSVYSLASDPVTNCFFSGAGDRIVARWSPENPGDGELVARSTEAVYSLCFLDQSRQLLIGQASGGVHVVNIHNGVEERLLHLHEAPVFSIISLPGTGQLVSLGGDGTMVVMEQDGLGIIHRIRLGDFKLRSMAVHPSGEYALVACGDGHIVRLQLPGFTIIDRFVSQHPGFSVNKVIFSPDGSLIYTGGRDAFLRVFEADSLRQLAEIPAHNYAIYDIAFDPGASVFATASRDKTVKIWNPASLSVVSRVEAGTGKGHVNSVNKLLWVGEGKLLSAGDDRNIRLWSFS